MSSEQSSEECSEDMHEDDQNKIIRLKAQAVQLYDKYSHKKFQVHVMNEAKLSKEQKARLWHWRLGHQPYELMKWLVDEGLVDEMEIKAVLNEDCATCDNTRLTIWESAGLRPKSMTAKFITYAGLGPQTRGKHLKTRL